GLHWGRAPVAQRIEHQSSELRVGGSSPSRRAISPAHTAGTGHPVSPPVFDKSPTGVLRARCHEKLIAFHPLPLATRHSDESSSFVIESTNQPDGVCRQTDFEARPSIQSGPFKGRSARKNP